MTTSQTEIESIPLEDLVPYEDDGNTNEHRTHIVNPAMNVDIQRKYGRMDARTIVSTARMFGEEIVALCGYRWVPKRNPELYEACNNCMTIAGHIMKEDG